MPHISLTEQDQQTFKSDGFVILPDVLSTDEIEAARNRFEPLFRGEFETGTEPDEWNWREGRDDPSLTRQICNGWRADRTISNIVLAQCVGEACARLRGWPGARLNQDNIIWKPPGTRPLGFHQDESYQSWNVPGEMMTCWITLDDTRADQGTIEYVRGSHKWPLSDAIGQFHGPDDPLADMNIAAAVAKAEPEIVPIVVKAGTAVIHHGRTWHGSRDNRGDKPRRSVVAHCMSSESTFHPVHDHPVYGRYRRDDQSMPEDAFPLIWRAEKSA